MASSSRRLSPRDNWLATIPALLNAASASLPVLMLTAKGQRIDRETALKCGADLFITKPFANADITAAVNQLADKARATSD
ncbi:MAG: response regulator [Gammaproteobacteria bacterium]|nr:response regulator [Gammaproteobacteria bacterium]